MGAVVAWIRRFDEALSRRCPIVWRTRLVLALVIGLLDLAVAWQGARVVPVGLTSLPDPRTTVSTFSILSFALLGVVGVFVADQIRRVGSVASLSQVVRVGLSVALASGVMLSVPYVFLRTILPRVAASETADTVQFHAAHRYWRCYASAEELQALLDEPTTRRLRADLARHGMQLLERRWFLDSTCLDRHESHLTSLAVLPAAFEVKADVDPFDDLPRQMAASELLGRLEGGLGQIAAAQAFTTRGVPYEAGLLSSPPTVLLTSLGFGVVAGAWVATTLWRRRLWHAVPSVPGVHVRWFRRADEAIALRLPFLWCTQVHASAVALAAITLCGLWLAGSEPAITASAYFALIILLPWPLVPRQQYMRGLPRDSRWEVAASAVHGTLLLAIVLGISRATGLHIGFLGDVLETFLALWALMSAAWLQSVRRAPLLPVALGFSLTLGLSIGAAAISADVAKLDLLVVVALLMFVAASIALSRSQQWPGVARVLASSGVMLTPLAISGVCTLVLGGNAEDHAWPIYILAMVATGFVLSQLPISIGGPAR